MEKIEVEVRRINKLGRIVVPKRFKAELGITERSLIAIDIEGDKIILSKTVDTKKACVFCKHLDEGMKEYKGKFICKKCLKEMKKHDKSNRMYNKKFIEF